MTSPHGAREVVGTVLVLLLGMGVLGACGTGSEPSSHDAFVGSWGDQPGLRLAADGTAELEDGCRISYGTWDTRGSERVILVLDEQSEMSPCAYATQLPEVIDGAEMHGGTLRLTSSASDDTWVLREDGPVVCEFAEMKATVDGEDTCELPTGSL